MDLLFPLLIVFMIGMIFFSNRQRKKQAAQQESLQNAISVGDVVVMTSGISGTVVDTDDEKTIDLEIAPDVITTWLRAAVREKLSGDADTVIGGDHLEDAYRGESYRGDTEHHEVIDAATDHTTDHTTATGTSAPTTNGTATPAAPSASSRDASSSDSFSDPTASPNGNGVSAGRNTPGDTRPSS